MVNSGFVFILEHRIPRSKNTDMILKYFQKILRNLTEHISEMSSEQFLKITSNHFQLL